MIKRQPRIVNSSIHIHPTFRNFRDPYMADKRKANVGDTITHKASSKV